MEIERKLQGMGIVLPEVPAAVANYVPCVLSGRILFVSGTTGTVDGKLPYAGKVGAEVDVEDAYRSARLCGLNHLAMLKQFLGDLDRVTRIVRLVGFVNGAPGFSDQPRVVNGESDLLVSLWGEAGRHARAAVGTSGLYGDAPVETVLTVEIAD